MRRRDFIKAIATGMALGPLAARAQQAGIPVIGFLRNTGPEPSGALVAVLRKGLGEAGYVEGTNLAIEYRWGAGQQEKLRSLADDLVRRNVAVIIGAGNAAVLAAKAATTTIPIVFAIGNDPVKSGYVGRLNRPEGNLTGITFLSNTLRTKQLELLHELVPKATVLAMLANPKVPATGDHVREQQKAAQVLGLSLKIFMAASESDLEPAFAQIAESQVGGLYIDGDSLFTGLHKQLVALSSRHKIPTIFNEREAVAAGGLMSYGASITDAYRQAGLYAGRILKGQKPAELPVIQASKFDLVINLNTAKELGLNVPLFLQQRADEVIE